jgi:D-lactate dehydrogenase (cytochrome)
MVLLCFEFLFYLMTRYDYDDYISGPIVGHVGDGNFHALLIFDNDNQEECDKVVKLANTMAQ